MLARALSSNSWPAFSSASWCSAVSGCSESISNARQALLSQGLAQLGRICDTQANSGSENLVGFLRITPDPHACVGQPMIENEVELDAEQVNLLLERVPQQGSAVGIEIGYERGALGTSQAGWAGTGNRMGKFARRRTLRHRSASPCRT